MLFSYIVIASIFVVFIAILFDIRLRKIDQTNQWILKRLEVIVNENNLKYPDPFQLGDEIVGLAKANKKHEACNLITKKFGCTYEQAEQSLEIWIK